MPGTQEDLCTDLTYMFKIDAQWFPILYRIFDFLQSFTLSPAGDTTICPVLGQISSTKCLETNKGDRKMESDMKIPDNLLMVVSNTSS